jgi:lactate racemase
MKTLKMKYGSGTIDVSVPEENLAGIIEKDIPTHGTTEESIVRNALDHPIESPRLRDLLKPGQTVAVVVSDITRLWQRPFTYLPMLVAELTAAGIRDKDIKFIGAIGLHRTQTAEEHAKILGPALAGRFRITDHDAKDSRNLTFIGTTRFNTPVWINKTAMDCDHMLLTGCCTYHPFFGWAGGKKSMLPGIAGFETVQRNHGMLLSEEIGKGQRPAVRCGNIAGNIVHEDAEEATEMVQPSFILNVVIGYDGKIAHAVAGHWHIAHEEACRLVERLYGVPIGELADLTIASQGGYPKDIEFYQTGKSIFNAQDSVKPGGTLIVLSECREGLGPEDARKIILDFSSTEERERDVRKLFSVPKYVCWDICAAADKYDLIVVSSIDKSLLSKTNVRVFKTLSEAIETVYSERGEALRTYLIPQGSSVLPIYRS